MNYKTLDRYHAIHVLNLICIVMALGVTCYFFDTMVTNKVVASIGNLLMTPVTMADKLLGVIAHTSISGNFSLMFIVLWISYAVPVTQLYPFLMVQKHDADDLHDWYFSRSIKS